MKKGMTLLLAALLVFSLAACGGKDQRSNDPLTRDDGTPQQGQQTPPPDNTEPPGDTAPEVDFGSIMAGNGATDTVWGKQDEATKQAIIADAKEDGLDVSFGADGSTTLKDPESGETFVQKPDGTWAYQNEDGGEAQIGGDWPDNEFTKLIPAASFTVTASMNYDGSCAISFSGATLEQIKDYAEQIKGAGFDKDAEISDMGESYYSYSATNADGYFIQVFYTSGRSGLNMEAPDAYDE